MRKALSQHPGKGFFLAAYSFGDSILNYRMVRAKHRNLRHGEIGENCGTWPSPSRDATGNPPPGRVLRQGGLRALSGAPASPLRQGTGGHPGLLPDAQPRPFDRRAEQGGPSAKRIAAIRAM